MKNLFFFICAFLVAAVTNATVRTVSNFPATLAQFNTIQAAVDASVDGDTVYVHGSPNQYAPFDVINKRLVVLGPGWGPNKQMPLEAVIHTDIFPSVIDLTGIAASGTELQGLTLIGGSGIRINTSGINNLKFLRLHFAGSPVVFSGIIGSWEGYLLEGCMFNNVQIRSDNPGVQNFSNFLFQNNIFYENGCCIGGNVQGFLNTSNVLFDHNLWYGPGGGSRDCFNSNCRFLTLTNNIFVRRNAANQNSFSSFNNNITFNTSDNTPWLTNSNTDAGGNVANQDPQMVDQAIVNAGSLNGTANFTIASGPADNAGADGKDMGLLFDASGTLNWANSRLSRLPYIFSMNITTPTIAAGGTLSVTVEARKSN